MQTSKKFYSSIFLHPSVLMEYMQISHRTIWENCGMEMEGKHCNIWLLYNLFDQTLITETECFLQSNENNTIYMAKEIMIALLKFAGQIEWQPLLLFTGNTAALITDLSDCRCYLALLI